MELTNYYKRILSLFQNNNPFSTPRFISEENKGSLDILSPVPVFLSEQKAFRSLHDYSSLRYEMALELFCTAVDDLKDCV
jgi:hypothetical protein